jgi:alpha-L-fucosidase
VTGIKTKPVKAYMLRDKLQSPLEFDHHEVFTEIHLPAAQPDQLISVVVLEYDTKPEVTDGLVAKTVDGGFSLKHENIISETGNFTFQGYDRRGTVPPHIVISDKYHATWKIFVEKPGQLGMDVSYSFQGKKPSGVVKISAAEMSLNHDVAPTALTVGEPNSNWHIENFKSHSIGYINFPKAGIYEISVEIEAKKGAPVNFQWLWVK